MKHYLINPTWQCHNTGLCSYCWVTQTVRTRTEMIGAEVRSLYDWAQAINRDKPDVVDIAGGEPLLIGWIPGLLQMCPDTQFGLSTNGLASRALAQLCRAKPTNLLAINVSYHPDAAVRNNRYDKRWAEAIDTVLAFGGRPHVNIVDAPGNVEAAKDTIAWLALKGIKYEISPYEEMGDLGTKLEQGLCCEGGVNHLNVAPDGQAWPCLTTMRSPFWAETCLGNWIDGEIDLSRKEQPCHLACVDYYTLQHEHEAGDMWNIQAEPCEEGA